MVSAPNGQSSPLVIRRYRNRRMYDPSRAAYITYDDLRCLVSKGVDFVVQDNNGNYILDSPPSHSWNFSTTPPIWSSLILSPFSSTISCPFGCRR